MSRRTVWFAVLRDQEDRETVPASRHGRAAQDAFLVPPDPTARGGAPGDAPMIDVRTLRPPIGDRGPYLEVME